MFQRAEWFHLDVLANGGHLCIRWRITREVDRTEMPQLPLLAAIRIRGPFQRDHEPQGQQGIDAVNEVSRDSGQTQSKRTICIYFRREAETVNSKSLPLKLVVNSQERNLCGKILQWLHLTITKRRGERAKGLYLH